MSSPLKQTSYWQAELWNLRLVDGFSIIDKDSLGRTDSIIISTGKGPLMTWKQKAA